MRTTLKKSFLGGMGKARSKRVRRGEDAELLENSLELCVELSLEISLKLFFESSFALK